MVLFSGKGTGKHRMEQSGPPVSWSTMGTLAGTAAAIAGVVMWASSVEQAAQGVDQQAAPAGQPPAAAAPTSPAPTTGSAGAATTPVPKLSIAWPSDSPTTEHTLGSGNAAEVSQELLALVNARRAEEQMPLLKLDTCLTEQLAQPWAEQLASTNTLSHRPMGEMPEKCPGIMTAGENIAEKQPNAEAVMEVWMSSPQHRKNIMNPFFTKFGGGVAGQGDQLYWVQNFAT